MQVLDGKIVAQKVKKRVSEAIKKALLTQKRPPGLAVVLIGENPASQVYVKNKIKA